MTVTEVTEVTHFLGFVRKGKNCYEEVVAAVDLSHSSPSKTGCGRTSVLQRSSIYEHVGLIAPITCM